QQVRPTTALASGGGGSNTLVGDADYESDQLHAELVQRGIEPIAILVRHVASCDGSVEVRILGMAGWPPPPRSREVRSDARCFPPAGGAPGDDHPPAGPLSLPFPAHHPPPR